MPELSELVRATSAGSESIELLRKSPAEILGVSAAAAAALDSVGIHSIFDLGTSNLFTSARAVLNLRLPDNPANRFGLVAADLLIDDASFESLAEIPELPISKLRVLTPAQAANLTATLDVTSIRDMALWPPHMAARRLVGEGVGSSISAEDLQTEELRPRMGQYPTERVYYSTLVMLEMLGDSGKSIELNGAISLDPALTDGAGLTRPAVGALLTFSQSWYSQGVTLGHMLHSLALAPGEATRIAVIDWSRRTRATTSETVSESQQLDSATEHARALSEVQSAVANDFQEGGSSSSSSSASGSTSAAVAQSTGFLTSLVVSGDASATMQGAFSTANAESSSWSLGNRSVLGAMTQNVNDRTEQHSSDVRNRRASAVREVSQSEHEQVSTRIVANYNHMHALTVQYYEVVQIYRTEARLHNADRCLFVPIALLDFSYPDGMKIVERFRMSLIAAALNRRIASLLIDDTTAVSIKPVVPVKFTSMVARPLLYAAPLRSAMVAQPVSEVLSATPVAMAAAAPATAAPMALAVVPMLRLWDDNAVALAARILNRPLLRPDADGLHVPDDTELLSISFDNLTVRSVRLDHVGAASAETFTVPNDTARIDLPRGVPMIELDAISVSKADDAARSGTMTLYCSYQGRRFTLPAIPLDLAQGTSLRRVVTFSNDQTDRRKELLQHLQGQREYYSRAVFRTLDSATLTLILSKYKWNGRPLIDIVEPRPVKVAGNYLILRAPVDGTEQSGLMLGGKPASWQAYLASRGMKLDQPANQRVIPIPTGGVFAEAVLGRSNSAEKLDITRFWNWQDSPIPLSPPEIAPVGTGSRATAEDLKPGQLSSPVLNIVNPTQLPAPDSMGTVLNALSNMNFRDMSGLSGTQGLVKAGMEGTLQAATEAGQLASTNMQTEAQKAVAMGQIASDLAKSVISAYTGVPMAGGGSVNGISGEGARINHGRSMDERGLFGAPAAAPSGGSVDAGALPSGGDGAGGISGGGSSGGGGVPAPGYSREVSYSDQGAYGFSPDAVADTTAPYQNVSAPAPPPTMPSTQVRQAFVASVSVVTFANGADINAYFASTTGQNFVDWFNATLANRGEWVGRAITGVDPFGNHALDATIDVVRQRFIDFWDRIPIIYAPATEINLFQFMALMSIGINERNGNMVSRAEGGGLKYMYEAGSKQSYNKAPNKTALECFQSADFNAAHQAKALGSTLANTTNAAWAGQVYPNGVSAVSDASVTGYVQEADFYKFRGRGVVQTTWRNAYVGIIDFIKSYTGTNATILNYKAQWANTASEVVAYKSSNADWQTLFAEVDLCAHAIAIHSASKSNYLVFANDAAGLNGLQAGSIYFLGRSIGWPAYGHTLYRRVIQALNALGN